MKSPVQKKKQQEKAQRVSSPRNRGASKKKQPAPQTETFGEQLDRVAQAVENALAQRDLSIFYREFRASDLPFLPCEHKDEPHRLFRLCYEVLHRLGGLSPAVALAVENHYYVTSAIATMPADGNADLETQRQNFLGLVQQQKLLVANTNSRVQADKLGSLGTRARREEDGFRISGSAAYMSLATEADLVVFVTLLEGEGIAFFVAPLKESPDIEIGPYLFPNAMVDSDTRRVTFKDTALGPQSLLAAGRGAEVRALVRFELAWHQALIPALFLGAAARALEETRLFLRKVRTPEDAPLATLDGMVVDIGRLAIRYRTACALVRQAGETLAAVAMTPLSAETLTDAFDKANAAKYVGTLTAEEIVAAARRIVGARSFADGHPLERLSQEVVFGPLGGEVHALIERRYGQIALGENSFLDLRW